MKRVFTLFITVLMIGFVCFSGTNVKARADIYTDVAKSYVHEFNGAKQWFEIELEIRSVNGKNSIQKESKNWLTTKPSGASVRFERSDILASQTTATYKSWNGTSKIWVNSNRDIAYPYVTYYF